MSELKAISSGEIYYIIEYECSCITDDLYYPKSEADKVIEEKDAEIARLKAIRKVHVEAIESMGAGLLQDEEEKRHSKYKRCLAMAKLCHWKAAIFIYKKEKNDFYWRWYDRWKALAEKFKEAE